MTGGENCEPPVVSEPVSEADEAGAETPPVVAATSPDLAMIRFHGHNGENWEKRGISAAERFKYLYDTDELGKWVAPARELAGESEQLHVLMNNCCSDYAQRNARQLSDLLTPDEDEADQPA